MPGRKSAGKTSNVDSSDNTYRELENFVNFITKVILLKDKKAIQKEVQLFLESLLKTEKVKTFFCQESEVSKLLHSEGISEEVWYWVYSNRKVIISPTGDKFTVLIPFAFQDMIFGFSSTVIPDESKITKSTQEILNLLAFVISITLYKIHLAEEVTNRAKQFESMTNILNSIVEAINAGIIYTSSSDKIILINNNAAFMLGIDNKFAVLNKDIKEVMSEDIYNKFLEMKEMLLTSGFCMEKMFEYKIKPTYPIYYALNCAAISTGSDCNYLYILRDMSQSKEIERLRQFDMLKNTFLANISHDLKTPLTSIKAYTETLLEMESDQQKRDFLKVIDEESERLLHLIKSLLMVTRLETGNVKLELSSVNLYELIEKVVKVARAQTTIHQISISIPEQLKKISIKADGDKLNEVILNLVTNAIKYSPKGGKIDISVDQLDNNVISINVKDEGIGIAPEHLDKIFDAFYRVDSRYSAKIQGYGLGLAISKQIVELHGGTIKVKSELHKGSTFSVLLPLTQSPTK